MPPTAATTAPRLAVLRLWPSASLPSYAKTGDAGLDLCAAADTVIGPGQRAAVPTGLAVAIPAGHAGLVMPRSGLALRHGVTVINAPGLIDSGYRGELVVALVNHGVDPFAVRAGDRIAQLVVVPVATTYVEVVDELPESPGGGGARGTGGFGHTGS